MDASTKRMFHYRAGASPLGGHITHPTEKTIHTQAASSLAQAGVLGSLKDKIVEKKSS